MTLELDSRYSTDNLYFMDLRNHETSPNNTAPTVAYCGPLGHLRLRAADGGVQAAGHRRPGPGGADGRADAEGGRWRRRNEPWG